VAAAAAVELAASLAKLDALTQNYRFSDASTLLKNLTADPVGAQRTSLIFVTNSAAVFLSDLEADLAKSPVKGDFTLKSGGIIRQISISPAGDLTVSEADGTSRRASWGDFSADALVQLHRIFVKTPKSESERLRRTECAICYDWLVGNRDRALKAASYFSQSCADFKQRWEAIAGGLPK
jgi:hypothetical protein